MPKCSVVDCGVRKSKNQESLTLHRLPRNELKKKKWLEAIGTENIRPNLKDIFICCLHFNEDAFNKTLGVIRLRDDALPLQLSRTRQDSTTVLNGPNPTPDFPNLQGVETEIIHAAPQPVPGTSTDPFETVEVETEIIHAAPQPVPGTSIDPLETGESLKNKKLEDKCDSLRKKVKRLNETVRRQKKKIAMYEDIIKNLQEKNLVNNDSQNLPSKKQQQEETRKVA